TLPLLALLHDTAPPRIYTLSLHDALPIWATEPRGSGPIRRSRTRARTLRPRAIPIPSNRRCMIRTQGPRHRTNRGTPPPSASRTRRGRPAKRHEFLRTDAGRRPRGHRSPPGRPPGRTARPAATCDRRAVAGAAGPAAVRQPPVRLAGHTTAGEAPARRAADRRRGRQPVLRAAQAGLLRRGAGNHALAALPGLGLRRARAVPPREAAGRAAAGHRGRPVLRGLRLRLLAGAADGVPIPGDGRAGRRRDDDRHQRLPRLRAGGGAGLRAVLPAAGRAGGGLGAGPGHPAAAARGAWLRDRRRLHRRRGHHPAGRGVAADAGDPDVPAVRGGHHRRRLGAAAARGVTAPMQEAVVRGPHAAGFWQRATAWSLDALVPGLLALVFSWPLLAPALARLEAVSDAVLRELASAMAEALHAQIGGSAGLADLPLLLLPPTLQAAARLSPAVWAALWPPLLAFVVLLVAWF